MRMAGSGGGAAVIAGTEEERHPHVLQHRRDRVHRGAEQVDVENSGIGRTRPEKVEGILDPADGTQDDIAGVFQQLLKRHGRQRFIFHHKHPAAGMGRQLDRGLDNAEGDGLHHAAGLPGVAGNGELAEQAVLQPYEIERPPQL